MTIMPWTGPGMNPEQPWERPQGILGQRRRGGLFGASANIPQMPQTGTEQPQKPGFDWRKLLGVLGDSLSIAGGGQAQYVPSLIENRQRQQAQDYAEQQYQRRRQDENTDWQARQEYEAAHRPPPNNDTINDYQFIAERLGPEAAQNYLKSIADGPPIAVDVAGPDGSVTRQFIPRSQMQGGGGMVAPQAPVGKLKPYGGQSATPTGGFP